jgi:alpha-beta hydrolase superfamily lysophospholipase
MTNEHHEEYYITPGGQRLYCQSWMPAGQARGMVVLSHGFGEFSSRYQHFAQALNAAGFAAHLYDLRGHGHSEGRRGHIVRFSDYLKDLTAVIERQKQSHPELPLLLYGHSMGGLIVAAYAEESMVGDIKAIALTSPFLGLALKLPGWKLFTARNVNRIWPTFSMPTGFGGEVVSHDPEVVKYYDSDPLFLHKVTVGWFIEVDKAQQYVVAHAHKIQKPLLIIQAGDDKLADPKVSETFSTGVSSASKEFKLLAGCYHEVINEPEYKLQAMAQIVNFYGQHLQ